MTACGPLMKSKASGIGIHIPVPTDLCDLCEERVSAEREPTCVHHCLAGVMKFGPIHELVLDLDKKPKQVLFVASVRAEAYRVFEKEGTAHLCGPGKEDNHVLQTS